MLIDGLVSTIIPVFNRPLLLQEAVASVFRQHYQPMELIIVDDGSSDETGLIADQLAEQNTGNIYVIHTANRGPGAAREAGRLRARGEFIQYLDSDDILLSGKFRQQVAGLRANVECGVSYGMTRYRHANGKAESKPWKRSGERIEHMFPSFLVSRWWDTPNPLYRRTVCDEAGPWLPTRAEEDWEYDCRIASICGRLHFVPEFVCEVRGRKVSNLVSNIAVKQQILRDRALAHERIYCIADSLGFSHGISEIEHLARALFFLSRQCGAAGLSRESERLFDLARVASGRERSHGADFLVYRWLAGIIGWKKMGSLAMTLDGWKKR